MFDREPLPDVLRCRDRSVRLEQPPARMWVNLSSWLGRRPGYEIRHTPGGVVAPREVPGWMLARVMTWDGHWLAYVVIELSRDGEPIMSAGMLVPEWCVRPWHRVAPHRR